MRKRVQVALIVLLVAIVGGIAWQLMRVREPVYRGRPLAAWIKEGYLLFPASDLTHQEANEAVLAVGTNALPYFLKLLETTQDSPLKIEVIRWLDQQKWLQLDFNTSMASFRRAIGVCGLSILGAQAKPAIPTISKLLSSGCDEDLIGRAAFTLPDIGLEGIQPLTNMLMNSTMQSRLQCAILALGSYGRANYRWSQRKARASEEIDTAAKIIVPILIPYLKDSNSNVQVCAIQSLGWFAREPETVVPAIVALLQNDRSDKRTRYMAVLALEDYGANAKLAIPVLEEALKDKDFDVRNEAAYALRRIAPDMTAKPGVN